MAVTMTNEEAIKELQKSHDMMRSYAIDESESRLMTALNMAVKALERKKKYRAKARHFKRKYLLLKDEILNKEVLMEGQEPKTGHWKETGNTGCIDIDNTILYQEMCDKCKGLAYFRKSDNKLVGATFCPNCGCRMVKPQERSDKE